MLGAKDLVTQVGDKFYPVEFTRPFKVPFVKLNADPMTSEREYFYEKHSTQVDLLEAPQL